MTCSDLTTWPGTRIVVPTMVASWHALLFHQLKSWEKSQRYDQPTIIIPPSQRSWRGYTGFTLSVCLSVDRIVSTLYLLQYTLDPFHIYTSYQATSEGVSCVQFFSEFKSFGKFFKFVTLSCFDLGSNMNWSIVWVIMGRQGISSERRHSSCSSLHRCDKERILWYNGETTGKPIFFFSFMSL